MSWVSVLPLDRNGGFAYGNNAGINAALAARRNVDYMVLLNPDTIVRQGAIRALVEFMESQPRVGIAGSRLEAAGGRVECSAHNAPSPLGELEAGARLGLLSRTLHRYAVTGSSREVAHECDWVSGASLVIRCEVFQSIGFMDDAYFLYFEEVDFCARARQAGWEIWYVPESRIVHFEGISTGIKDLRSRRPSYWFESRRRYFISYYGVLGLIIADLLWCIGRFSLSLRSTLGLGSARQQQHPKWFTFDLLWGDLRALITGRAWRIPSRKDRIQPSV